MSLPRILPHLWILALVIAPAWAEDETPETKPEDVKEKIVAALKKIEDKKYTFDGTITVEAGGSEMFNFELKGAHSKPYMKIDTEMMGQSVEAWSDGKSAVQKNPQTGQWEKAQQQNITGVADPSQVAKMIKKAEWDGDGKVGDRECRVAKATVDKDEIKKLIGEGGAMGGGKMKKSSIKFYISKDDGQIYRIKATMTFSMDMGGGGEPMDMTAAMDYKFKYPEKLELEVPKEVKKLFEESGNDGDEKKEGDDDKEEGSGK